MPLELDVWVAVVTVMLERVDRLEVLEVRDADEGNVVEAVVAVGETWEEHDARGVLDDGGWGVVVRS